MVLVVRRGLVIIKMTNGIYRYLKLLDAFEIDPTNSFEFKARF